MHRHSRTDRVAVKSPTVNEYARWLHRRSDTGNYFNFFRDYLNVMTIEEATVVQSTINLGASKGIDGWVRCTSSFLYEQLKLSRRQQDRILSSLKQKGFVAVESRGMPPNRWLSVNLVDIETAIDSQLHRGGANITTKPRNNNTNASSTKKPNTVAQAPLATTAMDDPYELGMDIPATKQPTQAAVSMACRLHEALKQVGQRLRKWSLSGWARFAQRTIDKYPPQYRVNAVLDWYVNQLGKTKVENKYIPVVESARSFYEKFERIEAAMARSAERNPKVTVGAEAQSIVKRLRRQQWPAGAGAELPVAVQLSLDNVAKFRKKVSNVGLSGDAGFMRRVLNRITSSFVESWFEGISRWALDKPNLKLIPNRVVTVDHEDFQNAGLSLAREYGSQRHWDTLMKEIGQ